MEKEISTFCAYCIIFIYIWDFSHEAAQYSAFIFAFISQFSQKYKMPSIFPLRFPLNFCKKESIKVFNHLFCEIPTGRILKIV